MQTGIEQIYDRLNGIDERYLRVAVNRDDHF